MKDRQRGIPTLFHRRLKLLTWMMILTMLPIGGQLVRLSIVEGAERAERAELALHRRSYLPTYRGTIYDRHGRQLAIDRPGYAIAVEYSVITGEWITKKARSQAARNSVRDPAMAFEDDSPIPSDVDNVALRMSCCTVHSPVLNCGAVPQCTLPMSASWIAQ